MTATDTVTHSGPEAARLAGVTYRQVHYWCSEGVLGPEHQRPLGSGTPRRLTAEDVRLLQAIGRVSGALVELAGLGQQVGPSKTGSLALYRRVVERVLAGATEIRFQLTDHVTLTVDVGDLCGGGAG